MDHQSSITSPPPLPPRKPSEAAAKEEPSISRGPTPPSLPARKAPPPPIKTPSQLAREQVRSAPILVSDHGPSTAPAVSVTPATPVIGEDSRARDADPDLSTTLTGSFPSSDSFGGGSEVVQSFWTDLQEWLPYPDLLVVGMILFDLYWAKGSLRWVVLLGGAYALLRRHHHVGLRAGMVKAKTGNETPKDDGKSSPVGWLNHTLYALFPLISTDVLTPFIDLMEDALIQQCPAIVTSVRLTSASLGAQPVLLTSLKPLSDEEWFKSLAPPKEEKGKGKDETSRHSRIKSESSVAPNLRPAPNLERTSSSSSTSGRSRSSSNATLSSGAAEGERRRKRDRVLQRLSRSRRREASGQTLDTNEPSQAVRPEGNRDTLKPDDAEGENPLPAEEDIDAERCVNYQVGFTYDRPDALSRKGWGLHVLAYIGWGVKGIGRSEIPVYIDVLSIRGTVNLRMLLSATPPFVRTATFSFPHLPVVDLSAVPLRKTGFDAMGLPGMKSYVQASIAEVASAFVRPHAYSLDVERLLVGRDSSLRTHSIGALQIVIHSATGLRRTDTVGSCDPYVVVSYSKFNKPLFSTRTIVDTLTPVWEESTFLLVSRDAVESGERLRVRLVDADRFSSDDALGVVEEDLVDLVEAAQIDSASALPLRRTSQLEADHPGMRVSGTLDWSVRFYPLWELPQEELQRRLKEKSHRKGEPDPNAPQKQPWFLELFNSFMQGQAWEKDRAARRRETLDWFTGEKEREEMEAAMKPSEEMRSGVLQFHIHQCDDLEIEMVQGTFSSPSRRSHDLSSAGGKPALSEVIDRTPAENTEPPSAYCEVHLNDALVYRTRTKQITPSPYYNAVSERFVRDWRMAKVVFVVRDERNLEHDAILGLVSLSLADVFSTSSQFTRWFPLVGGLGWGRIRLSLLFKPIDIKLPPFVSGYQVATLSIRSLSATQIRASPTSLSVLIETEIDSFELCDPEEIEDDGGVATPDDTPSIADRQLTRSGSFKSLGSAARSSFDFSQAVDVEWEISKPIRLAVQYRHSCNVVLRFFSKSNVRRKKRVRGIACVRLHDVPDNRVFGKSVPIFETDDVRVAVKASYEFEQDNDHESEVSRPDTPDVLDTPMSSKSFGKNPHGDGHILGFVNLKFKIYPGVSRAHDKITKKDLRFKRVYEAWEIAREVEKGWDKVNSRDITRIAKDEAKVKIGKPHGSTHEVGVSRRQLDDEAGDLDNLDGISDDDSDADEDDHVGTVDGSTPAHRGPGKKISKGSLDDDEGESGIFSEAKAHAKALHKRNKGVFQLKIVRTGKYFVDKLQAKALSKKDMSRQRGTDLDVEFEGQSHL